MTRTFDGWVIKDERCEWCNGQGSLVFVVCADCERLSVICDEVGTAYLNPHDLGAAIYGATSAGIECPDCGRNYQDFLPAREKQISLCRFPSERTEFQTGIFDPR